jgi:hypothetical protein
MRSGLFEQAAEGGSRALQVHMAGMSSSPQIAHLRM